jgi:hypothetical protein
MLKLWAAITIGSCTLWVNAVSAVDFTVDRVVFENGHRLRATLFCRADMWRIEHNATGPVHVTIVRKDKGIIWLLLPRTKHFVTLPFERDMGPSCQHDLITEQRRERIGTEILQGRQTTVSEVTVREGSEDVTYYEWRADDVQIPLRLARKDGSWLADYHNLRITRLSPQLFELPLNYHPIQ